MEWFICDKLVKMYYELNIKINEIPPERYAMSKKKKKKNEMKN